METIIINDKEYQLDVEKAKELGLLKEKDSKPRSWEEYVKMAETVQIVPCDVYANYFDKKDQGRRITYDVFNSEEEARAFCALGKLIQLRDAWWGEWKPDWNDIFKIKYCISVVRNEAKIVNYCVCHALLVFPTEEMTTDFFKTFRNLIEQAKMFL